VQELRAALRAAALVNARLIAIQNSKHEISGLPFDSLAWFESSDDPSARLPQWERLIADYGFGE
jgi:hypothetical protein